MTDRRRSGDDLVRFMQHVGIICGASIATISLVNMLGGFAIAQIVKPAVAEMIADERKARMYSDSLQTSALVSLSADRVDILAIVASRPGKERNTIIERARRRWNLEK